MSTTPINVAPYLASEKWIARLTLLLGSLAAIAVACFYGANWRGGILVGAILAWFNFRWLRQGLDALTTAATAQANRRNPRVPIGTYFKSLFRYACIAVARPGALQQAAELLLTNPLGFGIKHLLEENVAHGGDKFIAFTGSISIFILLSNLLSVFPSFSAPTAVVVVPLACASLTFIYFNWQGLKHHGVGNYLLTFAGSPKTAADFALAFLLFPVDLTTTPPTLLSPSLPLFPNIF